jgi:hypothetical protein
VGPSVLVLLAGLMVGLVINAIRAILFENLICRKIGYEAHFFQKIGAADRIVTFRVFVDEHLRYHQFYGGIAIGMLLMFSGWIRTNRSSCSLNTLLIMAGSFLVIESAVIFNAIANYGRSVNRVNELARGYTVQAKAAGA